MGLGTTLIGIAIFLIVIMVGVSYFGDVFGMLIDTTTGYYTATQLQPRPNANELICDLRITTIASLETSSILGKELGIDDNSNPFPAKIFVTIDESNPVSYEWFECYKTPNTFALVDLDETSFDLFSFFSFGGEKIHTEIVLIDSNDSTQRVDANTQQQLRQSITLSTEAGFIETPLNVGQTFVVKNIPARDYILEVYYGRQINDLDSFEPFVMTIDGLQS